MRCIGITARTVAFLMFAATTAQATLIDIIVEGTWENVSPNNAVNTLGLQQGDIFRFVATYDDTTLFDGPNGVTATLDPTVNPGTSLLLIIPHTAGSPNPLIFTHADHTDIGFAPFAEIEFDGSDPTTDPGVFRNFEFHVDFVFDGDAMSFDTFTVVQPQSEIRNFGQGAAAVALGVGEDHLLVTPEPSTALLLATGLAALASKRRRR